MKRHEVLGRSLRETLATTKHLLKKRWDRTEKCLNDPARPNAEFRYDQLSWAVGQAAMQHLGFGPVEGLASILQNGAQSAVSFFTDDWWKTHQDDRYVMEKQNEYPVQGWHWAWRDGLLLCDWTGCWENAKPILNWVDDDVGRGISHGDPYLIYHLYLASSILGRLANHDELEAWIKKKGSRYEKQLVRVCDSISQGDSARFQTEFAQAIQMFHRSQAQDVPNFLFWVSLDASLLWTLADRSGLELPVLNDLEDAAVVRRETVFAAGDSDSIEQKPKGWTFWKR